MSMFSRHRFQSLPAIAGFLTMSLICLCGAAEIPARILYVDAGFEGENQTGESWLTAYSSLQKAIDAARNIGRAELWVKAGIYKPEGTNRNNGFTLYPGIDLYGGFRGSESRKDQRNPVAFRTILTGDIGKVGLDTDNCYHVLTACSDAFVSGLIIVKGNADGMETKGTGGGLLVPQGTSHLVVSDCTFEKNSAGWHGGAIYVNQAEVAISNCTFYSNGAASGGALATKGPSSVTIHKSTFSSNYARNSGGAVHLTTKTRGIVTESTFLCNSSQATAGALSAHSKAPNDLRLEIRNCGFNGNRAREDAGALLFEGKFEPRIIDSKFENNVCVGGIGTIANRGGVTALVKNCEFVTNQGMPDSENIGSDDRSSVVDDLDKLAGMESPEEKKAEPKRQLPDVPVFDSQNNKHTLPDIVHAAPYTVLVLGELTDPDFIENYRSIEAMAKDFKPKHVGFFYIYRFLTHPENNGYVQPFNQLERARQVQHSQDLLKTETDWLYDTMENQTAEALAPENTKSVFLFSKSGEELYSGTLEEMESLRNALENIAGPSDTKTDPDQFPAPRIAAVNPMKPLVLDRIHFDPENEHYLPLDIVPKESQTPYYAKLRAEASQELLQTGNGRLYLGFNLDPLYRMEWNNEESALKYEIRPMKGVVAPSVKSAPIISEYATDTDPREFILSARQLDTTQPIMLRVQYSVYSPALKRSANIQQQYIINLRPDPFGGKAYRRQLPYKDTPLQRNQPSTAIPYQLRQYDANGDGKLTRGEVTGSLWSKFPEIDSNHDGYLSIEEYADFLRSR